jgi:hypothetical protein
MNLDKFGNFIKISSNRNFLLVLPQMLTIMNFWQQLFLGRLAPVQAASPHFIGTPTIKKVISGNTANLFTSGKVAGLGSAPTNFFLTSSGGSATYQCLNPGGNSPPPKVLTFGQLHGQVVTIQPRNGQITFSNVVLPGPPAPSPTQVVAPILAGVSHYCISPLAT